MKPNGAVLDLMSGMGEMWPTIDRRLHEGSLIGIHFSSAMCAGSKATADRLTGRDIRIMEGDALNNACPPVVSM